MIDEKIRRLRLQLGRMKITKLADLVAAKDAEIERLRAELAVFRRAESATT